MSGIFAGFDFAEILIVTASIHPSRRHHVYVLKSL